MTNKDLDNEIDAMLDQLDNPKPKKYKMSEVAKKTRSENLAKGRQMKMEKLNKKRQPKQYEYSYEGDDNDDDEVVDDALADDDDEYEPDDVYTRPRRGMVPISDDIDRRLTRLERLAVMGGKRKVMGKPKRIIKKVTVETQQVGKPVSKPGHDQQTAAASKKIEDLLGL